MQLKTKPADNNKFIEKVYIESTISSEHRFLQKYNDQQNLDNLSRYIALFIALFSLD